jgi:2-hydroxychromene-2-carboxylate isomerase
VKVEFFFDCSSPWTYLAFERIQPLAAEFGVTIIWRPILVGGIFNAVNPGVEFREFAERAPKRKVDYYLKDLGDWARATGLSIKLPPTGHPVSSVKVMRGCCVLEHEPAMVAFARAAFSAYFGDDRLISDDSVIADLCLEAGVEPGWLFDRIAAQPAKDVLRANVDEAIARGVFGSPTIFLNETDMYFGVDRLQLLRVAMDRCRHAEGAITAT